MQSYIPPQINSSVQDLKLTDDILYWYPWISHLQNKNTWLALAQKWKSDGSFPDCPPAGHEYYILTGDSLMFGFAEQIAKETGGQVIALTGPMIESNLSSDKVTYLPYTFDHWRVERMPKSWRIDKKIQFKASALTNRVTQSKAIIFSALQTLLSDNAVYSLNHAHWHPKNVHYWEMTGNAVCDTYTKNFMANWLDKKIQLEHDDFIEGSYNNTAYQNSALNFTQESYHYSFMSSNGQSLIEPGPFLTEKTFKCVLSKTAFVPVGQYYSYHWLKQMGMKFDYGELDLSFDNDPGNITRLEKIIDLIKSLQLFSAMDLYEMTKESSEFNFDHVMSKDFWKQCENYNVPTFNFLADL